MRRTILTLNYKSFAKRGLFIFANGLNPHGWLGDPTDTKKMSSFNVLGSGRRPGWLARGFASPWFWGRTGLGFT
jgi:hypothetical protein